MRQISKLDSLGFKRQPLGFFVVEDCLVGKTCCGMIKMCVGRGESALFQETWE